MVNISGAKNSAGPILAAALLSKQASIIDNLPLIEDIFNLIEILESMGVEIEWLGDKKIKIQVGKDFSPQRIALSLIGKSRVSVLLIGALLVRFEQFKFARPGGDKIGLRPITTHLEALKKLGVRVSRKNDFYCFDSQDLRGGEVVLREFSVTATETLMMAAAGTKGKTIIKGAATEPHVRHLGEMLNKMGARIKGLGNHILEIEGTNELNGVEHDVLSDHIEAETYFVIGAVTPGMVEIRNIVLEDLWNFLAKMEEIGVRFEKGEDWLRVDYSPELKPTRFQSLPWPGFPTDILPIVVPLMTQAQGKTLIHDPLYENRLNYVHELRKMGADIEIVDPHRALIFGKTPLRGIEISSWDIRAGASLVVAGLMAEGETVINNIYQIDRGYEKMEEKLMAIGAEIKRIKS